MRKLFSRMFLGMGIFTLLFIAGCGGNDAEDKLIKIGNTPYDYEYPIIAITEIIAEELGYETEVVEGDIGPLYESMAQGDIDIWPGIWLPTLHESFQEKHADTYELGSEIYQSALSGLTVTEDSQLNSVEEVKGNEHIFDNKIIGIEPGSGVMKRAEKFIEDYDLDLELVAGSTSSMLAEVEQAINFGEEILFLGWRPHAMFMKYDIRGLEDPEGYFNRDYYYWGIRHGFEEKSEELYKFVTNFEMDTEVMEDFLHRMEQGEDRVDLAKEWIEENRSEIDSWLE